MWYGIRRKERGFIQLNILFFLLIVAAMLVVGLLFALYNGTSSGKLATSEKAIQSIVDLANSSIFATQYVNTKNKVTAQKLLDAIKDVKITTDKKVGDIASLTDSSAPIYVYNDSNGWGRVSIRLTNIFPESQASIIKADLGDDDGIIYISYVPEMQGYNCYIDDPPVHPCIGFEITSTTTP